MARLAVIALLFTILLAVCNVKRQQHGFNNGAADVGVAAFATPLRFHTASFRPNRISAITTPLTARYSLENASTDRGDDQTKHPIKQRGGSQVELGIQTAQLLLANDNRGQLKRNLAERVPFVPDALLESAIIMVATAFKRVAPNVLKQALQPGGMAKIRPVLKQTIVDLILQQDMVKQFRILSDKDKSKLLSALADLALDQLLKDATWVLATPQVRLEALHDEITQIQRYEMTTMQVWVYRVRRHRLRYIAVVMAAVFYAYGQLVHAGSMYKALLCMYQGLLVTARHVPRLWKNVVRVLNGR